MRTRIYVSLFGESFSPVEFHKLVAEKVDGYVGQRRSEIVPPTALPMTYWATSELQPEHDQVATSLCDLIESLDPWIGQIPDHRRVRVIAHIVLEFEQGEEPQGFYFPERLIRSLAAVHAELDIDAVPHIS